MQKSPKVTKYKCYGQFLYNEKLTTSLSCATIWALSNIENDIWKFGVKFEVELSRQHKKPIYHLKACNFRIAIMKNNFSHFGSHDLGHVTPSLTEISLKFQQFSRKLRIKGLTICLREKCIINEMLPMKFTFK